MEEGTDIPQRDNPRNSPRAIDASNEINGHDKIGVGSGKKWGIGRRGLEERGRTWKNGQGWVGGWVYQLGKGQIDLVFKRNV